jgi:hypothetical protein
MDRTILPALSKWSGSSTRYSGFLRTPNSIFRRILMKGEEVNERATDIMGDAEKTNRQLTSRAKRTGRFLPDGLTSYEGNLGCKPAVSTTQVAFSRCRTLRQPVG